MRYGHMTSLAVAGMACVLALGACSDDTTPTAEPDPTTSTTTTSVAEGGPPETAPTTIPFIDPPESTTTTTRSPVEPEGCTIFAGSLQRVDVAADDPDGGLNLRSGPGTTNSIVSVMPDGVTVETLGDCELDATGQKWFSIGSTYNDDVSGWAAASYLEPYSPSSCDSGATSLAGLTRISESRGDFDGDGTTDVLTLGVDEVAEAVRMQVAFANGGFAGGDLDARAYWEVVDVFRPLGSDRDAVMFRDPWAGGASTSHFVFADIQDCTPTVFGGTSAGASVGWGSIGYCLEATELGKRFWYIDGTIGETEEERIANTTKTPFTYRDGAWVEAAAPSGYDDADCEPPYIVATYHGANFTVTHAPGITGESFDELAAQIGQPLGGDSFEMRGDPVGIDAQGGFVTYVFSGLKDDSVGGYTIVINFTNVRNTDGSLVGYEVVGADATPLCMRGVTEDGLCS